MPQTVKTVAAPNGKASECLSSRAPTNAPANIRRMEIARLCHRGLLPPAKEESAANPVIVSVKTVVVKSGWAIFRTVAFLSPIARPVRTMTAYKRVESEGTDPIDASVAPSRNAASHPNAVILHRLLESGANVVARRPPITAPTKNAARAVRERNADNPGTPAKAKPRSTILP